MGRTLPKLLPILQQRLKNVGEHLRLARLRRRLSTAQLAERAGISLPTLLAVERGEPSTSFGAYANVLFCLGLESDLDLLGHDDELGRKLQDAELTVKRRAPRHKSVAPDQSAAPTAQNRS